MSKIEQEDGWFRMRVKSRSRSELTHLVDLAENNFGGWCGCEHHAFAVQPRWTSGEHVPFSERCQHVRAAIIWWFDCVAPKVAKALDKKPDFDSL